MKNGSARCGEKSANRQEEGTRDYGRSKREERARELRKVKRKSVSVCTLLKSTQRKSIISTYKQIDCSCIFPLSLLFLPVVALILWTAMWSHLYREKWEMLSQIPHNLRASNSIILAGSGEQCSLWQNSWSIVGDVREMVRMWVSVWVRLFGSCEEMTCWNVYVLRIMLKNCTISETPTQIYSGPKKYFDT